MIYVLARSTPAFNALMARQTIHHIIAKLTTHLADPEVCRHAMLAIGGSPFVRVHPVDPGCVCACISEGALSH